MTPILTENTSKRPRQRIRFTKMQPLRFHPILKRAVWGGRRLGLEYGKPIGEHTDYAESWEVSDLPGSVSVVDGGKFEGQRLDDLMVSHREQLMGEHRDREQFPLLMKLLDANRPLSVQVHPGSHLGTGEASETPSKAELWMVLDAKPRNQISIGLKEGVTAREMKKAVKSGAVSDCLNTLEAHPGDRFFLPPGTVHSLGEGVLIAEVQQTCDVTYRLDDWGRLGIDGKPRELHVDQALATIDYDLGPVAPIEPNIDRDEPTVHRLVDNQYFAANQLIGPGAIPVPADNRAHVLTLLAGTARIEGEVSMMMMRGDALLLPADRPFTQIQVDDSAILLDAFLGDHVN